MIIVRDREGSPIAVVDGKTTIKVFFYEGRMMKKLELRKIVPESLENFLKKIEDGIITTKDLRMFVN